MPNYVLITQDVSQRVLDYLKKSKIDFKEYPFNPVLDHSSVDFHDRNNGWNCWQVCDNFIEGLEWEDYRIKPKTPEEAQKGDLSEHLACNRGWTKYRCKAYQNQDNPKGITTNVSWIVCNHCAHYVPRTLEGRKGVLIEIRKEYEKQLVQLQQQITGLEAELEKQTQEKK